jgi:hypothetical protein
MGTISLSIPQSGVVNSSEDPKVASDLMTLQTLVNGNLDASNLAPGAFLRNRNTGGATTVITGELVFAEGTGSYTATLTAPVLNGVLGVVNLIAGGGVVTVAGTNINGAGLVGASSFTLGAYGSFALLISDGSGWAIIAGQPDSGWVALTLGTNIGAVSGQTPYVRLRGDRVDLRGAVQTTAIEPDSSPLVTIPAGAGRPAAPITPLLLSTNTSLTTGSWAPQAFTVATNGGIATANTLGLTSGVYVALHNVTFSAT